MYRFVQATRPCAAGSPSRSAMPVYSALSAKLYAIRPTADAHRYAPAGCAGRSR